MIRQLFFSGSSRRNNQGFVLILTLLCALILTAVMMSTMFISTKSQKVTKNFKESVQTLNAADAAIKQAKGALNAWLVSEQMASGSEVNFTDILTGSESAGKLVIPSNGEDWGALNIFGNSVKVTVSDSEGASDSDRIVVLQAEATSATRQRVKIEASIQAPSEINTAGGMPNIAHAALMCNDIMAKRQRIIVQNGSLISGYDHPFPALFPSSTTDYNSAIDGVVTGDSKVAAALVNAAKQRVNLFGTGDIKGVIGGAPQSGASAVETLGSYSACGDLFAFADQLSLLSDSLPNVNVLTSATVDSSTNLGTRDNPKITILNGVTTVTKKKTSKSKVKIDSGAKGAGILILQGETETDDNILVAGKNFYFEGLIIVYGDDKAVFRMKEDEMIYGSVLVLTGSEDDASVERVRLKKNSNLAYSKAALDNANAAYGRALGSPAIVSPSDPRNSTITIGWHEEYGF